MARRKTQPTFAVSARINTEMNECLERYMDNHDCTVAAALTQALELLFERENVANTEE